MATVASLEFAQPTNVLILSHAINVADNSNIGESTIEGDDMHN